MTDAAHSEPSPVGGARLASWAMRYALCRRSLLAGALMALLLRAALELLRPWPTVFLVDYALGGRPAPAWLANLLQRLPYTETATGLVGWAVLATILTFAATWAAGLTAQYASISLGQRMVYDLAGDLYARLQELSLDFHRRNRVGDLVRRLTTDCTCVSVIVKDALLPVFAGSLTLAAMVLILSQVNLHLTLLALSVIPYLAVVLHRYARRMTLRSQEQQENESVIYSHVEQTFAAINAVQAYTREDWHAERLRAAEEKTVAATVTLTAVQLKFKLLAGLGTALGTAVLLAYGTSQAATGRLTVGELVLFITYLAAFYEPLVGVMYSTAVIQTAAASAVRVREFLHTPSPPEKRGAILLGHSKGDIRFEQVTFGYHSNQPVLKELALHIAPGERLALAGTTGAGKSTLVSLVPRFFDPWSGCVLVDGHDVRKVTLQSLRRQVAMVLQEPFLFPITIAENIAYGRPHASFADIQAAARSARAEEFIRRLPNGYATVIGERGATLSVGERQRLSIARAVLKNAPILILDEPASALDVGTEAELLAALEAVTQGRTTLIIAHRLSTICRSDRIAVLRQGTIVETGSYDELLARGGAFAELHRERFDVKS